MTLHPPSVRDILFINRGLDVSTNVKSGGNKVQKRRERNVNELPLAPGRASLNKNAKKYIKTISALWICTLKTEKSGIPTADWHF